MASFDYTFTSGDTVTPTKLNSARNVKDIVNADIKSDAAIALSKLAIGALPAAITVASDNLVDGTIVNADINASAAIAGTKVAPNFGSQNVTTTGEGTFAAVHSTGNTPHLMISETDASANNKKWDIMADSEAMFVRAVNDAYTSAGNAIEIQRTGATIDSVSMPNGNVGIGVNLPSAKLEIVGSTTIASEQNVAAKIGAGITSDVLIGSTNGNTPFVASQAAYPLSLRTNATERMRIDASGNVGIGTASPTVKLDVNGGIASSTAVPLHMKDSDFKYITCESSHLAFYKKAGAYDFYFRKSDDGTQNGSNQAELMIIKDSGNVGIGTASPSTKLEVNGTVTATAFSGNVTGTASAIADGSVSTAKIVDGNVTNAKLASDIDASKLTTGTLPIARIADGAVTPAKLSQPLTLATAQATTSGTSIDFTGIPSWVKRITVMFNAVSTNGSSNYLIRIGAGSYESSGYSSTIWTPSSSTQSTAGFIAFSPVGAANNAVGIVQLSLLGSNVWVESGALAFGNTNSTGWTSAGQHSGLSGSLDRIRLTTVNGTDTFDAGTINIAYEG
jgi:hypothetical protein